jgi:hypothetical protein
MQVPKCKPNSWGVTMDRLDLAEIVMVTLTATLV